MLATCRELGIAVVGYSPVGRGLLTGTVTSRSDLRDGDWRRLAPRFAEENLDLGARSFGPGRRRGDRVHVGAGGAGGAGVVLAQGGDILPIPGTKRVSYLEENVAAGALSLTGEQLARLAGAVPAGAVAGERYPDFALDKVGH